MCAAAAARGAGASSTAARRRPRWRLLDVVVVTIGDDAQCFERAYRRLWGALHRGDDPDLSQHERQLLHHLSPRHGRTLTSLAEHLALPKSTASVIVKDLERRGFLRRRRDSADERRLAIALTGKGAARVARDSVLDLDKLAAGLGALPPERRRDLVRQLDELVGIVEHLAADDDARGRGARARRLRSRAAATDDHRRGDPGGVAPSHGSRSR